MTSKLTPEEMMMLLLTGSSAPDYKDRGSFAKVPCYEKKMDKATKKIMDAALKKANEHKYGRRHKSVPLAFDAWRRQEVIRNRLRRKLGKQSLK